MTAFYLDADAQVKIFVNEPGSRWVRELVNAPDLDSDPLLGLATIQVSQVEVASALSILNRLGRIGKRLRDSAFRDYLDFAEARLRLIAIDVSLISQASALAQKHPLKALSALHLAAALRLGRELSLRQISLTLVSSDHQLLNAARREGLLTENPQDHETAS